MSKAVSEVEFMQLAMDKTIGDALRGATASEKGYFLSSVKQRFADIDRENNKTLFRLRAKLAARSKQ